MIGTFGPEVEAKCMWCCKLEDGVQAKFQDGLSGHFCWKHFQQAVKARSETKEETASVENQTGRRPAVA